MSVIRLRPFESATLDDRSKERYRRISLSAIGSAAARGISVLTGLISVPLTLGYLGAERYGLWLVISSTIVMLGFADLGIGNGLINAVSEANGRDDRELAARYVSSAFFLLLGIAVLLGTSCVVILPRVPWSWLFNATEQRAVLEAGPAMAVFAACFLLNIPLGIVERIQLGYQESFVNSLWQACGNLLGLGGVLLAISLRASLPWMVLAMAGAPLLATLINGAVLFRMRRPWLLPRLEFVSPAAARQLVRAGTLFFALQIAMALGYQADNLVISHFLGASSVPVYSVPMKLFMLFPLLSSFVIRPLWPAYAEALARRDVNWIRKAFARSVKLALGINVAAALVLVPFFPRIADIWIGSQIAAPTVLLVGLGIWIVLNGVGGPIAMLLNGTNTIGLQVVFGLSMGVSNLILSIVLVQKIGVAGPIYGTIATWTLFNLIPYVVYIHRLLAGWDATTRSKADAGSLA